MTTQKKTPSQPKKNKPPNLWAQRAKVVGATALTAFICISLISYHHTDPSFIFESSLPQTTANLCGWMGAHGAALLLYFFGSAAWLIPLLLMYYVRIIMFELNWKRELDRLVGGGCLLFLAPAITRYYSCEWYQNVYAGGWVGGGMLSLIELFIAREHIALFLFVSTWALLVIIARFSSISYIYPVLESLNKIPLTKLKYPFIACMSWLKKLITRKEIPQSFEEPFEHTTMPATHVREEQMVIPAYADKTADLRRKDIDDSDDEEEEDEDSDKVVHTGDGVNYRLPPLSLFPTVKDTQADEISHTDGQQRAQTLEHKLERFGIKGKVVSITQGPVVTLFEYQPSIDTKISTIVAREDDLALALQALSLRIIAPIPGRSVIGFEVAHNKRKAVLFAHALKSNNFSSFTGSLPLILGKDTLGSDVVIDLAGMPHLLVAGSTGSGKSVGLHTMIMSLLCSKTPDEIKFILIDPKRLEFAAYADCAHLIFPIVTDPRRAISVLKWAVETMEERYAYMAQAGVRNCAEFNSRSKPGQDDHFPLIVIIIDELADLMMTAGKDVEQCIARLAQMARAAGIHLIAATQRPSVDVITGLIKVNFPSRIAYKVTSKVDSRTILDMIGAEKLLGRGDMLYLDVKGAVHRVHGAYVTDTEITAVVNHIKSQRQVQYKELVSQRTEEADQENDDLFQDVLQYIKNKDEVSISLVQRVFRIGYNRSARIIDQLESYGYILPADGSKMRKVSKDS